MGKGEMSGSAGGRTYGHADIRTCGHTHRGEGGHTDRRVNGQVARTEFAGSGLVCCGRRFFAPFRMTVCRAQGERLAMAGVYTPPRLGSRLNGNDDRVQWEKALLLVHWTGILRSVQNDSWGVRVSGGFADGERGVVGRWQVGEKIRATAQRPKRPPLPVYGGRAPAGPRL